MLRALGHGRRFVDLLKTTGQLENTYIVYSSDHGYHLGEFSMLYDKRMLYETDIRVPLLVRGRHGSGQNITLPVNHIDIPPTICLAGDRANIMDGRSWAPLVSSGDRAAAAAAAATWRTEFMVEYSGGRPLPNSQHHKHLSKTLAINSDLQAENDAFAGSMCLPNSKCSASTDNEMSLQGKCSCTIGHLSGNDHDISPCDGKNNTYACVRTLGGGKNTMYCEFNDPEVSRTL